MAHESSAGEVPVPVAAAFQPMLRIKSRSTPA